MLSRRFLTIEGDSMPLNVKLFIGLFMPTFNFYCQVWREYPDRIVGFPSRLHYWNNTSLTWAYDSEWKNQHSLILTGMSTRFMQIFKFHIFIFFYWMHNEWFETLTLLRTYN